jgi:hypothetical protein
MPSLEQDFEMARGAIQDDWHVYSMGWEPALAALSRIEDEVMRQRYETKAARDRCFALMVERDALQAALRAAYPYIYRYGSTEEIVAAREVLEEVDGA